MRVCGGKNMLASHSGRLAVVSGLSWPARKAVSVCGRALYPLSILLRLCERVLYTPVYPQYTKTNPPSFKTHCVHFLGYHVLMAAAFKFVWEAMNPNSPPAYFTNGHQCVGERSQCLANTVPVMAPVFLNGSYLGGYGATECSPLSDYG